ncbi:hypothetical protein [Rubricoccus marinus]|uniref:MarR family transcriptional regulator n=1 Tax=Rubricoccus marinus TaxID=716817 RepID=A0A259TZT4_9BACT|nr:hypothetical protein [Rubricoccus marinus]OZC03107.1 hypothetical protein BSZ36_09060 [Rubricoccus marinus]
MPETETRTVTQEVLFQLARIPGAVHRDDLAKAAGTTPDYAGRVLGKLVQTGHAARVGRGTYKLTRNVKQ